MPLDVPAFGEVAPEPGMLEELFGLMLVALFMLLGPLAAEGEPAELCMAPAFMPPMPGSVMPAPAWVEPA